MMNNLLTGAAIVVVAMIAFSVAVLVMVTYLGLGLLAALLGGING